MFNSSEKRLARTLLLLARYGEPEASHRKLPRIAREAAGLRKEALQRIQELTAESSDREMREAERSGGVMTDDNGPPKKEA